MESVAVEPHLHDNGHCFRDEENRVENSDQFPEEATLQNNYDSLQEPVEISDSRSDTVFIDPETLNDVDISLRSQSHVAHDVTSRGGSNPTEERYPRLSNIQRLIDYRLNRLSSQCSLTESQQDLLKAVSFNIQTIIEKGYLIEYKPRNKTKQYIENSSTDFNVIDDITDSYKVIDESANSPKSRLSEPISTHLNLEENSFSRRIKEPNMSTPKDLQGNVSNSTLSLTDYPTLPITNYPTHQLTDYPTFPLTGYPVNRQSLCAVRLSVGIEDSGLFSNASIGNIFHQQVSYDRINSGNITEPFYEAVDGYQLDESVSDHTYQSVNSLWADVLARTQASSQPFYEPIDLRQSGGTDDLPYYLQPLNTLERLGCQATGGCEDYINDCPDTKRDVENSHHPVLRKHLEKGGWDSDSGDSYEPIDCGLDCPNNVSQNSNQQADSNRRDWSDTETLSGTIDRLIDAVSTDDASEAGRQGEDIVSTDDASDDATEAGRQGEDVVSTDAASDDADDENYYNGFDSGDPLIGERRVCRFYPVRKVYTTSPRRNYNFHPTGGCGSVLIDFSRL
ncbi:hypothetical protein SNE40_017385 [Patella caerulea]